MKRPRIMGEATILVMLGIVAFGGCSRIPYPGTGQEPFLTYRLTLKDADLRVVHVTGTVFAAPAKEVLVRSVGDASGKRCEPIDLRATDGAGATLPVRAAADAWLIESGGRDFSFEYDVVFTSENRYSGDVRDMISFIDSDRCRLLGRDVFLVPELPIASGIVIDAGLAPGWHLSSSDRAIRNRIIVDQWDELSVALVVSGAYRRLTRTVAGSDLILAIADRWSFEDEEFFDVVSRVVSEEIALFGSSPRSRYLIVCDANPVRGSVRFDYYGIHYGGSIILFLDPKLDRSELMDSPMSIIAHEFFHNWNGEALGPASDGFLWFTEGVTVYYSYLVLERAGIMTHGQYLKRRQTIGQRYRLNPYASTTSVGEAANSDMRDKNMVNLLYDGGFLAAEALDARLKHETGGSVSLIDVLKRMYRDASGEGVVDESLFLRATRELCGSDLSEFVKLLVHTPAPEALIRPASSLE